MHGNSPCPCSVLVSVGALTFDWHTLNASAFFKRLGGVRWGRCRAMPTEELYGSLRLTSNVAETPYCLLFAWLINLGHANAGFPISYHAF